MKKKKLLSLALAITMLFGSAAALPSNVFTAQTEMMVYADEYKDFYYESCDYRFDDGTVEIVGYIGSGDKVTIPSKIEGKTVVCIGSGAFGNESITSVSIPDTVKTIDDYAFSGCTKLTDVRMSNRLISIGDCAFNDCLSLKSISIPSSVTSIGNSAFYGCTSLTSSITIPCGVKTVSDNAFNGCTNLKDVTFQNGVTSIGNQAFYCCSNLSNITIPSSVTTIGDYAFQKCSGLESVIMQDGLVDIGDGAFSVCPNLESINIPSTIINIGSLAFVETKWLSNKRNIDPFVIVNGILIDGFTCSGEITIPNIVTQIAPGAFGSYLHIDGYIHKCTIEKVTIPDSVKSIGDGAFGDCNRLEKVVLNCMISRIGDGTFSCCNQLRDIILPQSITSIGESAFYECYKLSSIEIPDGVKAIEEETFKYCTSLTEITIPKQLESVGQSAFECCTNLSSIMLLSSVKKIGWAAFYGCENLTIVLNKNSYAESYAKEHNIPYVYIEDVGDSQFAITTDVEFRYGNYKEPIRDYSFHYSDNMLTKEPDAEVLSEDIAKFSSNLAVAAYEKDTIVSCLKKMGFKSNNIKYSETYDFKPTYEDNDRVAYTIAYKKVNGKDLFVVPIRGTHGNCEWFSDFNIGTGDNHEGFYKAANRVKTTLITEMKKRNVKSENVVLYFTGHSRGAAVANILAGEFSTSGYELDGYNVNIPVKQIFAYTYACPAVSKALNKEDIALKNIYNYINPGDLIPALPLESWGYTRYGNNQKRTIMLPTNGNVYYDFLHRFNDYRGTKYEGEDAKTVDDITGSLSVILNDVNSESTQMIFEYVAIWMMKDTPESILPCTIDELKGKLCKKHKISIVNPEKQIAAIYDTLTKKNVIAILLNLDSFISLFTSKAVAHAHTGETYVKWVEAMYDTRTNPGHIFQNSETPAVVGALGYKSQKCSICGKKIVVNYKPDSIENVVKNVEKDLNLTFHRCAEDNKTYGLFKSVEIDGKTVDPSNYSTQSGSLKLTLDKSFVSNLSVGTHKVIVLFEDGFSETSIYVAENADDPTVNRLSGSGRFATAAKISNKNYGFENASTVVLTNGYKFADALAGVPYAQKLNAPILLTDKDSLPAETLAEIKRLGATNVIILGGSGSVGAEVKQTLTDNGLEYDIVKGSSRFATAVRIAEETQKITKTDPTEIFFVSSDKFADALSVSSIAALKNAPIIYLPKTGAIDDVTSAYLKTMKGKIKNAYVIGGSGVISNEVVKAAGKALGLTVDKTIVRVKGSTKYDTCVAVNTKFASVLTGKAICVATGEDFPDALAGGVFSAVKTAPLFLAAGTLSDTQKSYLKSKNADSIYVFGGSKSVPDTLVQNIAKASV